MTVCFPAFLSLLQEAPIDLFASDVEPEEYSRVWVEGVFDHAGSQYVGPRMRQIAGNSKQVRVATVGSGWVRGGLGMLPLACARSQAAPCSCG